MVNEYKTSIVILAPDNQPTPVYRNLAQNIANIVHSHLPNAKIAKANDLDTLKSLFLRKWDILFSFGTSIIVPKSILDTPNLISVNIHGASPKYPGRDSHHFAIYDEVSKYGATLHFMSEFVDEGPIIDVQFFNVDKNDKPIDLLLKSQEVGHTLTSNFFQNYSRGILPKPHLKYKWEGVKRTRSDFLKLCEVESDIGREEFFRICKACNMPKYKNVHTYIQGQRFNLIQSDESRE